MGGSGEDKGRGREEGRGKDEGSTLRRRRLARPERGESGGGERVTERSSAP